MAEDSIAEYSKTLDALGIEHRVLEHPHLQTPPEVQEYFGLTLADGLSTMLMKAGETFIAVVRRCDMRLDSKKLKKLVGNKLRMATAEEFAHITHGLPLGTARVLTPGVPTYLDTKLFEKEFLTSGSGSFAASVSVRSEDLKKIPGAQVVAIS